MKKSLVAVAVLVAAGAASAQSSVTLFGIVDATFAYGKAGVAKRTQLTNSGYNSSRLGFRGTEDLGGGMSASFWLEAGVNNDSGAGQATNLNNQASGTLSGAAQAARPGDIGLTFNRRSTVSLAGGFGELRLGRDYSPQFWNFTVFDPFGTNGVGTTQTLGSSLGGPTIVRASNSIGYFLPNMGGLYGQIQTSLGENASNAANKKDGNGTGLRIGYAAGPINAAFAYSSTKYATGNIKSTNFGGQYDLGVAKLMAHVNRDKVNGGAKGSGYLIGALVPMGAGEIRASYSQGKTDAAGTPKTKKFAIGYVHNLSKRTAVYGTYANLKNSGGASAALNGSIANVNGKSGGYDVGIRHSF